MPVKIVQTQDKHGTKKISVMIDFSYIADSEYNLKNKLDDFKKMYFTMLDSAKKLFFGKSDGVKYQRLPSSTYWKLGKILESFNESIENDFLITNYYKAVSRDFGLSQDYISDLFCIIKYFKEDEIIDSVYFSYYRALKRKRSILVSLGLFDQEKKRLNKLGAANNLPGREKYKKQLMDRINKKTIIQEE